MSLTVCASSTDVDLTTTGKLKAVLLGATASSTVYDGALSDVIRRASRWAESYIDGGPLTVQSYQETVPGYGGRGLRLMQHPLRAVPRVYDTTTTEDASQVTSTMFAVEHEAGMLTRPIGWPWTVPLQGHVWDEAVPLGIQPMGGQEYQPFLVDYVAGWTYAGVDTGSVNWSTEKGTTSTGRTVPEDVEHAVILKARDLYRNDLNVSRERLGDLEVNYRSMSGERSDAPFKTQAEILLDPYRRLV